MTRYLRPCAVVLGASLTICSLTGSASAGVLFVEDFSDATLAAGSNIDGDQAAVSDGVLNVNDNNTTDKGVFVVQQPFNASVMTFSFDVVAPVVATGPLVDKTVPPDGIPDVHETELLLRTGRGTGTDSIGSADDIQELILQRDDGNRNGYVNNGNESIFLVVNNNAGSIQFASPVDGSTITLNDKQHVAFIRNNNTGNYVQSFAPAAWQLPAESITRFFIGSGSDADQDTFSIDNVGVVDEVSFQTVAVPEPSALALLGAGGLLALRRRRSA
jgi:hypothetical protein